ncbi:MAG: D-alanyl-D-alanine carboxypeptidase [Firmicutes bacterium]|nr:D-alanyl-D-alanine carboxypeptidase [Bacillota bacterium]
MKRFQIGLILILVFILSFSTLGFAQLAQPFEVEATSALLLDFESGQVLFSQNGQSPHVPASLVKIMTMYVAFDQIAMGKISLDDTTRVSERPWRMTGSKMFLEPNEVVTIDQLLTGIAVVSGNDACVALAEALAGSEALYVQWMNEKAESLGLDLYFVDVHGLSDENKITAEAIAYLVQNYLRDYPEAIKYHQQESFSYQPRSSKTPIVQPNRNGLLRSFEGADGLKTGHLQVAGYNLVGTAVQNNRRLISVVLGATSEASRERETAKLLNYGYRSFDLVNISRLLEDKTTKVYKGKQKGVGMYITEPIITVPKGVQKSVSVSIQTKNLEAPVLKGTQVGVLSIFLGEELTKQVPLLASEEVPRGNLWRVMWDSVILFFQDLIKKR